MTPIERQARQECIDRGRDPDRDMTGPDGPLKAWELYADPLPWRDGRVDDAPTRGTEKC